MKKIKEKVLQFLECYKYWVAGVVIFFFVIICIFFFISSNDEDIYQLPEVKTKEEEEPVVSKTYKVDIKGAVVNPGVYEMEGESRVEDVIVKSGGLTEDADTSILNLSKSLKDEMVIIIYTKKELESMRKGNTTIKYIEKECICPKLENDACIEDQITNEESNSNENENQSPGKVSLNHASLSELTQLTGIGEKKAQAIIEYRNKNGGFKTIDEITKVSGIGKSIYEKIKDQLTL